MKCWCPHGYRWYRPCPDCIEDGYVDTNELIDALCMSVWRERGSVGFLVGPTLYAATDPRPFMAEVQRDLLRHDAE